MDASQSATNTVALQGLTVEQLILVVGLVMSVFYGINAVNIFQRSDAKVKYPKYRLSWWIHQVWINLVGSSIGWASVYVLYDNLFMSGASDWIAKVTLAHVFLFFTGVLGIMGFLPKTIWGISNSMAYMTEKVLGKIK